MDSQSVLTDNVIVQRAVPSELRATVPVASPGKPDSARSADAPKLIVSEADWPSAVMENGAGVVPVTCERSAPPEVAGVAPDSAEPVEVAAPGVIDCPCPPETTEPDCPGAVPPDEWPDAACPPLGVVSVPDEPGIANDWALGRLLGPRGAALECDTAKKMAAPAATPMAAPKRARRGPRGVWRVKRPPTVVECPTCLQPVL